jgi:hypothetical protein
MLVPFTEKTYEKYIAIELGRKTNRSFSPDQCLEAILGFDDGFFLPWPPLGSFLPFYSTADARHWTGILLSELEHVSAEIGQHLPPFRLNLFLQHKRPDHMKRATAEEWNSWKCRYFRYATTPHQQALLEKIDAHASGRAVTLYASAAFFTSEKLFEFAEEGTVLDNSNLAKVADLTGHERYTYVEPGASGIACSEPTPIEGDGLAALERMESFEGLPLDKHIIAAAKTVAAVVEQSSADSRRLYERASNALRYPEGTRTGPFLRAIKSLSAFSDAFGVSYYAVG